MRFRWKRGCLQLESMEHFFICMVHSAQGKDLACIYSMFFTLRLIYNSKSVVLVVMCSLGTTTSCVVGYNNYFPQSRNFKWKRERNFQDCTRYCSPGFRKFCENQHSLISCENGVLAKAISGFALLCSSNASCTTTPWKRIPEFLHFPPIVAVSIFGQNCILHDASGLERSSLSSVPQCLFSLGDAEWN